MARYVRRLASTRLFRRARAIRLRRLPTNWIGGPDHRLLASPQAGRTLRGVLSSDQPFAGTFSRAADRESSTPLLRRNEDVRTRAEHANGGCGFASGFFGS